MFETEAECLNHVRMMFESNLLFALLFTVKEPAASFGALYGLSLFMIPLSKILGPQRLRRSTSNFLLEIGPNSRRYNLKKKKIDGCHVLIIKCIFAKVSIKGNMDK